VPYINATLKNTTINTCPQIHGICTVEYDSNMMTHLKFNSLKAELNPICYLLTLLGAHHFPHVSRI